MSDPTAPLNELAQLAASIEEEMANPRWDGLLPLSEGDAELILTALRAQQAQPVAWAEFDREGDLLGVTLYKPDGFWETKPLYLSPQAQTRREVVEEIKLLLRMMAASDKPADRGMVYEESLGMLVYSPAEHLLAQIDAIRALKEPQA